MSKQFSLKMLLPLALLAMLSTGCSSGGGNSSDPGDQNKPTPDSSNWNEMVWNRDNWS